MIKHALIADAEYFRFFQGHVKKFLELEPKTLEKAIRDSCVIKKTIVEEDEKETGKRRLLNCGHTLAHAVEQLSDYQISHGEAVAIGILVEAHISHSRGHLSKGEFEAIEKIFRDYEVPLRSLEGMEATRILDATILDKKSVKGKSRYVLLAKIGEPLAFEGQYCAAVAEPELQEAISWYRTLQRM